MTSPMTRKMLRELAEDEQARAYYPPKPERCAYRLVRTSGSIGRYLTQCQRAGRQIIYSGHTALTRPLCWQHAQMNLTHYRATDVRAVIEEVTR